MKRRLDAPEKPAGRPRVVPSRAGNRPDAHDGDGEKTLAEKAHRQLRNDILNGRLAPDARLRINQLQQHYGLGLSPLREALLRLSTEGLVLSQGQRGFVVAPVSLADLQDQTLARKALDIAALTQAIASGDADWEARVIAANHLLARTPLPLDATDVDAGRLWEERHRAFHRTLIAGGGSQWLVRLHNQMVDQAERYRTIRILNHKQAAAQVRDVVAEHAAITDAVLKRDTALACELLGRHIGATELAMRSFFESESDGADAR